MSLENGVVQGATYSHESAFLTVLENPTNNSVKCKCGVCGEENKYRVSDMKNNNIVACKSCAKGFKIGDIYNERFVLEYFWYTTEYAYTNVGIQRYKHKKVLCARLRCLKCNTSYAKQVAELKTGKTIRCEKCELKNTIKPEKIIKEKKEKKEKSLSGYVASIEEDRKTFNDYEKCGDFIRTDTASRRSKLGVSISNDIVAMCIKCAAVSHIKESEWKNGNCKCKKCGNIGDNSKNIIKNINWVGHTIRNLKIIKTRNDSDGVIKADIKCLLCGATYTFNLVSVLNECELLCIECADTKLEMRCLECGHNGITTTQRKLYRQEEGRTMFTCKHCKQLIDSSELLYKHEVETKFNSIRKQYKGLTLDKHISGREGIASLFLFKEGYTGRDGKQYNTCMCEEHNKFLLLNEDEINHYRHEFCADTRMQAYRPKKNIN